MSPRPDIGERRGSRLGRLLAVLLLSIFTTGATVQASGGIFVCPDGKGNKHFTNKWGAAKNTFAYDREINRCAARYRLDPNLVRAVIRAESDFNRHAVSRRGAQGLMQLMPATARELRVADPFNARQNIDGGTRYLRTLLDMFDGNMTLALAAYNAGPTLVRKIRKVPSFPETVLYVKRVLSFYEDYGDRRIADAFDRAQINVRGLVTVQ